MERIAPIDPRGEYHGDAAAFASHFGGFRKMPVPIMVPTNDGGGGQGAQRAPVRDAFQSMQLAFIYAGTKYRELYFRKIRLASQPTKNVMMAPS